MGHSYREGQVCRLDAHPADSGEGGRLPRSLSPKVGRYSWVASSRDRRGCPHLYGIDCKERGNNCPAAPTLIPAMKMSDEGTDVV